MTDSFLNTYWPSTYIAVFSALICALGAHIVSREWNAGLFQLNSHKSNSIDGKQVFLICTCTLAIFGFLRLITNSTSISGAIATLATAVPFVINKQRAANAIRTREMCWPETIDSLVSALQSGVSISDAVISLSDHCPAPLKPSFSRIKAGLLSGKTLDEVLLREKEKLDSAISDQVFETLIIAKEFGGKDSNNALRLLSEFLRDDIDVSEEIRTKFGWIRNSAVLASAAPWILIVLLSSQKSTVSAFATNTGVGVLILGVIMTALAYLWMERVGRLPEMARALR